MNILLTFLISLTIFMSGEKQSTPPGQGIILVDFDGYYSSIPLTIKNYNSPSLLSDSAQSIIVGCVQDYYSLWNVKVTRDEKLFYSLPSNKRIRVVVTEDSIPIIVYGMILVGYAGGRTLVYNSLYFNDTMPSIVSSSAFLQLRSIADAIAHEAGHQLGLAHQSTWVGAEKKEEYSLGKTIDEGPIMGISYQARQAVWTIGTNSYGQEQNDTAIISKTFKRIR